MTRPVSLPRRALGFSLLEVLVAFTLLALSLTVLLQIFSTGLRTAALADAYAQAVSLAESKLAEIGGSRFLTEGSAEGTFAEDYRWRAVVRTPPWWTGGEGVVPVRPYELSVRVSWGEQGSERSVSLTTLRLSGIP